MKKSVLSLFACGVVAAMIMSSCGAKYTPLTDDQKKAKADSVYAVKSVEETTAKTADCTKNLDAAVDAKVQELKAADATAAK
jgi:transposase-like protein